MAWLRSLQVLEALVRVSAPSLLEHYAGGLARGRVDARARWLGRRVVDVLAIDLQITGGLNIDPTRGYIYMSNHQSHLDIPILYASLPSPTVRMLGKVELFQIPLWGKVLRAAEFVAVDRRNHRAARASLDDAQRLLADGVSIYLAPEGTRSATGAVGPLKKGGFHLALATQVPIVPVAISGTFEIMPRETLNMATHRRVEVCIGAPIAPGTRPLPDLMAEVREFLVAQVHPTS